MVGQRRVVGSHTSEDAREAVALATGSGPRRWRRAKVRRQRRTSTERLAVSLIFACKQYHIRQIKASRYRLESTKRFGPGSDPLWRGVSPARYFSR